MSISMLLMSEKRERLSKNLCTHAGFSLRNKFTECVYESSSWKLSATGSFEESFREQTMRGIELIIKLQGKAKYERKVPLCL